MRITFIISIMYLIILIILLLLCLITNIAFKKWQLNLITLLSIFALSIVAYSTYPSLGTDLSRYYIELENMRFLGFEYVRTRALYSETFIANMLFYIVSLTEFNGLLPAVSTTLALGNFFYVLRKEIDILKPNYRLVSLYIFSFISIAFLRAVLTGVRQHWAWSVLLLAVFFDFLSDPRRKATSIVLYSASLFIHVATLPIIIIRAYYFLTKKYNFAKYLIIFWPVLIISFDNIANSLGGIFKYAYEKLFIYTEIEYQDNRLFTVRLIFFVLILLFAFYIKQKKIIRNNPNLNDYTNFFIYVSIFGLASLQIPHLFSRFVTFSIYMAFPVIKIFFDSINKELKLLAIFVIVFLIIGLISYQLVDLNASWRFYF